MLLTVLKVTLLPVEAAPEEPAGHHRNLKPELRNVLLVTCLTVVDGCDTQPGCALHQGAISFQLKHLHTRFHGFTKASLPHGKHLSSAAGLVVQGL